MNCLVHVGGEGHRYSDNEQATPGIDTIFRNAGLHDQSVFDAVDIEENGIHVKDRIGIVKIDEGRIRTGWGKSLVLFNLGN